jgi:hypothetical protein
MNAQGRGFIDITCNMGANVLITSSKYVLLLEKLLCCITEEAYANYNYFMLDRDFS